MGCSVPESPTTPTCSSIQFPTPASLSHSQLSAHFVIFTNTLSFFPSLSMWLCLSVHFACFSLSHPLFSRDALKLLVFHPPLRLPLHRSKLLWTMCPGWSVLVSFSHLFSLPSFLPWPSLHLFIQLERLGRGANKRRARVKQIRG